MRYIRLICTMIAGFLGVFTFNGTAQQINPVPDYIFRNQMSVGRNAPTDTAAYLSVGPRFGAVKGFMPPMVVDTNAVTGVKRNGLLIFSVQLNNFAYWDSTTNRFRKITAEAVVDSVLFATRAWRQKGDDSVASVRIGGSGVTGYIPKFTATRTLDSSQIFQQANRIGIGTASPVVRFDVRDEILATKLTVDTVGGMAYNSPWRASGTRTQFTGVTHWYGRTEGAGTPTGGGDFTFFKQRRGDSAMQYGEEIWYLQFRGKHRNNDANWYTNDSSNLANFKVNYAIHGNGTPTALYEFRAKGSTGANNQYLIIDPVSGDVDISNARLDVQRNLRVSDNALINDTLRVGEVNAINTAAFGTGILAVTSNSFVGINFSTYNNTNGNNSYLIMSKSRGSASSPSLVQSGDELGRIQFDGLINTSTVQSRPGASIAGFAEENYSSTASGGNLRFFTTASGTLSSSERLRIWSNGRISINSTTDKGDYRLQVNGVTYSENGYRTSNPTSGTAATWKLGTVATVSPTSPNRTIEVEIGGTIYYIHAKTTND